jgi:hypothetical protein
MNKVEKEEAFALQELYYWREINIKTWSERGWIEDAVVALVLRYLTRGAEAVNARHDVYIASHPVVLSEVFG